MHPLRAALSGLIDYAGLFPPASLALASTLDRFLAYADAPEAWLLGRLVLPVAQLEPVTAALQDVDRAQPRWTITAIPPPSGPADETMRAVDTFNARNQPGAAVVAIETPAATAADVRVLAAAFPVSLERYIELPADGIEPVLDAVAASGCYAKLRTGGLTADRIPGAAALAHLVAACHARSVPFKATAGLHHPVRGPYPLTYEPASTTASMHGFVNLVIAAAMQTVNGADEPTLARVLDETSPAAFTFDEDRAAWHGHELSADDLLLTRTRLLRSVGSCSFEEPVAELRALGWWPS